MANAVAPILRFMKETEVRLQKLESKQGKKTDKSTPNTISSDTITVGFRNYYTLVPESGTADDLISISGGSDGYFLTLSVQNPTDTITIKDSVGNLALNGDCVLSADLRTITLRFNRSVNKWLEISRSATGSGAGSGLDFVTAYPTNAIGANQHKEWYSVNFGIVGGLSIDEGTNIINMLAAVGAEGGGRVVLCAQNPTDFIYINRVVSIADDNITLDCRSNIVYGPNGSLRVMGKFDEFSRTISGAGMDVDAAAGDTVLFLSAVSGKMQASDFLLGDQVVLRGQNDVTGKAINKQITFVVAIDLINNSITISDELDFAMKVTYTPSDWNPSGSGDHATIFIATYSAFTGNVSANSMSAQVVDASLFNVGDYVKVSDSRNEHDMNNAAITGAGLPYKNPANLEICRIVAIDLPSNTITFDHALNFEYLTAWHGGICRMLPVRNSHIINARISYNADQTSKSVNSLQINFGVNCHIFDCEVQGDGGRRGQACRISYCYNCTGFNLRVVGAKFTGSGEGYGCTLYYTTLCNFHNCYVQGCRHSFLMQLATMFAISSCFSIDDRISGIDCHGVRSNKGLIFGNHVTRTNLHTNDADSGAGIRVGNTSHVNGDFNIDIFGNYIAGYVEVDMAAIDWVACSSYLTIQGNVIDDAYIGCRFSLNSKQITPVQLSHHIKVVNNSFSRCTSVCFTATGQPTYDNVHSNGTLANLTLLGNVSDGNAHHFHVIGASGITGVRAENNTAVNPIATSGAYGLLISNVVGFEAYRNTFHGCNRGISLTNCTGPAQVVGNILTGTLDSVPLTDGGGNTSWFHEGNHGYDFATGSGAWTTTGLGSLSASQTTTAPIVHNNSTVVITDGLQVVSLAVTGHAISNVVRVEAVVPYVSLAGATGDVTATLWAGSTPIGATTVRVTVGGSSGGPISVVGFYTVAALTAVTLQLRVGPGVNTNTLTFNSKFNGLSMPFIIATETS